MIDTQMLLERTDCRQLIEQDLGKPKHRGPRAWTWKCPLHHETRGHSFVSYPDGWTCFGACSRSGSAIDWLMAYHAMSFLEACEALGSGSLPAPPVSVPKREPQPVPDPEWQDRVWAIIEQAHSQLCQDPKALAYLKAERGLTEPTLQAAMIGVIPGHSGEWKTLHGLSVPCGITLPWLADNTVYALKVRRLSPRPNQPKYSQVAGGNSHGLYWADELNRCLPVLIVEGEFDTLLAWQHASDTLNVVTVGSAGYRIHNHWLPRLEACPTRLLCLDNDAAGQHGMEHLLSQFRGVTRCVTLPQGKDLTDFWRLAGDHFVEWLAGLV